MRRLEEALTTRARRGDPRGVDWLIEHLGRRLAGEAPVVVGMGGKELSMLRIPRFSWRGPLIATGALVIALAVALPLLLLGGGDGTAPIGTTTSSQPTTVPATTTAPAPSTSTTTVGTTTTLAGTTTISAPEPVPIPAMEWERLPAQPAFDQGYIEAVALGGPGLIAVGGINDEVAVWTSSDGRRWDRIEDHEPFEAGEVINDVVQGPAGLVGVGATSSGDGVVWLSDDGLVWERIDDPAFGRPGLQEIVGVAAGQGALVAVGNGERQALAWTSPDGTAWTRVEDESLQVPSTVLDIVSGDFGYVVVGAEFATDSTLIPALWISADGSDWDRVPSDVFVGDDPTAVVTALLGVAVSPAGDLLTWDNQSGLWFSPNGIDWTRLETPPAQLRGVTWDGGLVVGVGSDQGLYSPNAVMLASPDQALTWGTTHAEDGAAAVWVVRFDSDFIAFGFTLTPQNEQGPPVLWIGTVTG